MSVMETPGRQRDLYGEIGGLRHRRRELLRRREGAVERAAFFPSGVNDRHLAEIDDQLRQIDERLGRLGLETESSGLRDETA
jgi:hypothetical protein